MKDFNYLNNIEEFLKLFISNLIPIPQQKNASFIACELMKVSSGLLDTSGYILFNVKNFILTNIPIIIKRFLKIKDSNVLENILQESISPDNDPTLKSEIQARLLHEVSEPILNIKSEFNEKLGNVNSEFTSLEESGLIEFVEDLCFKSKTFDIQQEFTLAILETVESLIMEKNYEKLNYLVLSLITNAEAINLVVYHSKYKLLYQLIDFIDQERFKCDDEDENFQDFYSYFGVILLSVIFIIDYFQFEDFTKINVRGSYTIDYINNFYYRLNDNLTTTMKNLDDESQLIIDNYNNLLRDWTNLLFDDANDGLSDDLIKSLSIKQIYRLMPQIFKQAIIAVNLNKIDFSVLSNGLDYLSQNFLIPTTASILNWLIRDPSISHENKSKIIDEILKTNMADGESSSSTFRVVLKILSPNLGDFQLSSKIQDITQIQNSNERQLLTEQDINLRETFKLMILGKTEFNDQVFSNYYTNNKLCILKDLLQEVYDFQETNNEDSKLYIHLIIFLILNDSIKSKLDKEYWIDNLRVKTELNKESNTNLDLEFSLGMDNHYSSIFNDDVNQLTKNESDDIDQFLRNDNDMELDDDVYNESTYKVKTSEELEKILKSNFEKSNHLQLLANFKRAISENNLFYNSINLLTDKIIDSLNNWYI
ncbi:unnamed protein product [Candida verbasci]|uniref:Mediator of RNA polymerase II transcription subunit 5 n=1 Tax=Candida verbasci TaxID=1227364 RepID=A0A9W4XJL3_9ASCO|nr:unnamed protein product [Candida verbasci]